MTSRRRGAVETGCPAPASVVVLVAAAVVTAAAVGGLSFAAAATTAPEPATPRGVAAPAGSGVDAVAVGGRLADTGSPSPNVTEFDASSPDAGELNVSFTADQRLDNVTVDVHNTSELQSNSSAAPEFTLTEGDLAEGRSDGNYTYATTRTVAGGNYTATLERAENDSTGDGAGGESDATTVQALADGGLVYVVDTTGKGELRSVTTNGSVVSYATGDAEIVGIGPRADIDSDGQREVPYVNNSDGALYVVDDTDQAPQQIGDFSGSVSTRDKKSRLGIGDWDADGNVDVFFGAGGETDRFYRVDWDERNSPPQSISADIGGGKIQGVPASTDVNGDGVRDVILNGPSSGVTYYYLSDGDTEILGGGTNFYGENNNEGIGEPANMNDSESGSSGLKSTDFRFPVVTSSNELAVANPDGSSAGQTVVDNGASGAKTPLAAADFSGDGVPDPVYVETNNSVRWVALGGTPDAGASGVVTNESGAEIAAHVDIGLASRVSTFPTRQEFTVSPSNAGDETAPVIDNVSATTPRDRDITVSFDSNESLSEITLTVANVTGSNDTVVRTLSRDDFTETTAADGNLTYTNTTTVSTDGTYEANLTRAADAVGNDGVTSRTDTTTVSTDATAPSVADGNVSLTNPQSRDLTTSITSDEQLSTVTANLSNVTGSNDTVVRTLTTAAFTETDNGNGTYTYTNTTSVSADGTYEATLTRAEDAAGNDGASGQNDTAEVTTDTTAPIVTGVSLNDTGSGALSLSFDSNEDLATITVEVDGPTTPGVYTFAAGDFSESGSYTYSLSTTQQYDDGDGTYTATVTNATDDSGNNGGTDGVGSGLSDDYTLDTTGPQQAPSNVSATAVSGGDVEVAFDDVDDGTATYSVRRSTTAGGGYTEVGQVTDDDSADYVTTDAATTDGTTYYYVVVPVDGADNEGTASAEVSATADATAPSVAEVNATNPSGQDVQVELRTDEALGGGDAAINVTVDGPETAQLNRSAFTESTSGGTTTYTATYAASRDGTYTATVETAADPAGNDGASRENDSTTVDTPVTADAFASSYVAGVNETVTFSGGDSTVPNGSSPTYDWTVDGQTSAGEQVTQTFGSPGTYTAELALTADGTTSRDTVSVTIEDDTPPQAAVGADRTVDEGTTVSFDASGTTDNVGVASYDWDLDDDGTAEASTATASYTYDRPGTYTPTVTATDGAGNTDTATVEVTVRGPEAEATPSTVAFGNATVGTGNTSAVSLTNTGTTDLNVTGASLTGDTAAFTIPGDPAATRVVPGETATVDVGFAPQSTGDASATLAVTTNDTDAATVSVGLNGTGVSGDLSVDRSSVDYGTVDAGTTATADVTVTNDGGATATISSIGVAGRNDTQFALTDDSPQPSSLAPGETATLTVAFAPSTTGGQVGALEVRTPGATASVGLRGTGAGPDAGFPDADAVSFPETGKSETATESVTLTNYGTRRLNVSDAAVTGRNASAFAVTSSPSTVAPGASATVDVRFDPSAAGDHEATLEVDSNDTDAATVSVGLNATAVAAEIDASPQSVHFDSDGATLNVTATNLASSESNLTMSRTALVGQSPGAFTIVSGSAPFTLAPGETQRIELRFDPPAGATGTKEAQLRLISDAANSPQIDVWLTSAEAYIVVQSADDRFQPDGATETVNVDANNMATADDITVNISRPATRELDVELQALTMSNDSRSAYQTNVSYAPNATEDGVPALDEPDESTVSYVEIAHPNATFENTSVDYRVAKRDVADGVSPGEVTLWRYDGGWNAVDATFVREGADHYYYEASPPGFSQFAVSQPASAGGSSGDDPGDELSDDSDDGDEPDPGAGDDAGSGGTDDRPAAGGQTPTTPRSLDVAATPTPDGGAAPTPRSRAAADAGLAVVALDANRTSLVGPGDVRFVATVTNDDGATARTATVRLRVDGVVVDSREVTVAPDGSTDVTFGHRLTTAGDHRVVASLGSAAETSRRPATTVSLSGGDSCRLFGVNLGHFIVCWYWWVLLGVLLVALETLRRRRGEREAGEPTGRPSR